MMGVLPCSMALVGNITGDITGIVYYIVNYLYDDGYYVSLISTWTSGEVPVHTRYLRYQALKMAANTEYSVYTQFSTFPIDS